MYIHTTSKKKENEGRIEKKTTTQEKKDL